MVPELRSQRIPSKSTALSQPHCEVQDSGPGGLQTRAAQMSPRRPSHPLLIMTILPPALQGRAPVTMLKAAPLPPSSLPRGANVPVLSGAVELKTRVRISTFSFLLCSTSLGTFGWGALSSLKILRCLSVKRFATLLLSEELQQEHLPP